MSQGDDVPGLKLSGGLNPQTLLQGKPSIPPPLLNNPASITVVRMERGVSGPATSKLLLQGTFLPPHPPSPHAHPKYYCGITQHTGTAF